MQGIACFTVYHWLPHQISKALLKNWRELPALRRFYSIFLFLSALWSDYMARLKKEHSGASWNKQTMSDQRDQPTWNQKAQRTKEHDVQPSNSQMWWKTWTRRISHGLLDISCVICQYQHVILKAYEIKLSRFNFILDWVISRTSINQF